jgi:L-threonylcarbamoyladenylate synthase
LRTEVFAVDGVEPEKDVISRAAGVIRRGGLVAFPTETVYGLVGRCPVPEAVRRIFEAKGRPVDNPLIVHVGERDAADRLGQVDERSRRLMDLFWPDR